MPISRKVVIKCPTCSYSKVVTRGDCLPDASMFQKCPTCKELMKDSRIDYKEKNGIIDKISRLLKK